MALRTTVQVAFIEHKGLTLLSKGKLESASEPTKRVLHCAMDRTFEMIAEVSAIWYRINCSVGARVVHIEVRCRSHTVKLSLCNANGTQIFFFEATRSLKLGTFTMSTSGFCAINFTHCFT